MIPPNESIFDALSEMALIATLIASSSELITELDFTPSLILPNSCLRLSII